MNESTTHSMNTFIPTEVDDTVFFYARRVATDNHSWHLNVDANSCQVALRDNGEGLPTVNALRESALTETTEGAWTVYEGRVLISAGIILTVNGKVLMLQRDDKAPVDPLKWTSTAGRCDREPLLTALKEFYEEVVLFERSSGRPVFVDFLGHPYCEELQEIYAETLTRTGFAHPPEIWLHRPAAIPNYAHPFMREVKISFGPNVPGQSNEVFVGQFFPIFDRENNTLELRWLAELTVPPEVEADLGFLDGEYQRQARLFDKDEFAGMDASSLVYAMAYFKEQGFL